MNLIASYVLKYQWLFSLPHSPWGSWVSIFPSFLSSPFSSPSLSLVIVEKALFKILTRSSQEHLGIGVKPKCTCPPFSFYIIF